MIFFYPRKNIESFADLGVKEMFGKSSPNRYDAESGRHD